jgi:hypothetical protein
MVYPDKVVARYVIEKNIKPFIVRHINALYSHAKHIAEKRGLYL